MQEGRTEQNERRTLQREFDVRSLEKGEHTTQHLFDSLRKNSLADMCVQLAVHTILRTGDRSVRRKGDAKGTG